MFQLISILGFLLVIYLLFKMIRALPEGKNTFSGWLAGIMKEFSETLESVGNANLTDNIEPIKRLFYGITLISFVLLAISGFLPVIFSGQHLSGFLLMQHMVAGPVFALGLAGLALLYGYQLRFTSEDWQALATVFRRETDRDKFISQQQELLKKSTFWLSILLALPIILSVTLSMYPLYGPQDQDMLLKLHGYTGLVLLLVFVVYCWSAAASPKASGKQTKPKTSRGKTAGSK